MTTNVYLCGVGGHGVLSMSRILAEAALASGFDVRRSEVHGMSQRGGNVVSQVRYGERVASPLIPHGRADALLALELLEALRNLDQLRPGGLLLVNDQRLTPAPLGTGAVPYPPDPVARIRARVPEAVVVPAWSEAGRLGEPRAANMVLLGAFSVSAPEIGYGTWEATIEAAFPERHRDVNLRAFAGGRELVAARAG